MATRASIKDEAIPGGQEPPFPVSHDGLLVFRAPRERAKEALKNGREI